jgi:hypothetical protein
MDGMTATITNPFVVVVDSREQSPYSFEGIRADAAQRRRRIDIPTLVQGLPSGDYSIEGYANEIACERKSINDLFNTLSQGRRRFTAELERLNAMRFACVVVEAEWSEILRVPCKCCGVGPTNMHRHAHWPSLPRSLLPPKNVFRSVLAYQQRFPRVHWLMCVDRRHAEVTTFRVLERFWKTLERERKLQQQGAAANAAASNS